MRPFEWGLDWLPSNGHHQPHARGTCRRLGERGDARHAGLLRSRRRHPTTTSPKRRPTCANREKPARSVSRARSSRRIPRTTPSSGVGFRPRASRPWRDASGRGRAVVVMSQWNSDSEGHIGLSKLLARFGVSALRLSLPVSRCAHAARADARRLHRQLERRAHGAGVPPGGARRTARGGVAVCAGVRADRHSRDQPRVVPRDADLSARAAHPRAGAQPRVSRGSPTWCGAACRRVTCDRGSKVTSTSIGCGRCGGRSARSSTSIACATSGRCSSTRDYDLTFPVDLSEILVNEFRGQTAAARGLRAAMRALQHRRSALQVRRWVCVDEILERKSVVGSRLLVGSAGLRDRDRQSLSTDTPTTPTARCRSLRQAAAPAARSRLRPAHWRQ